MKYSVESLRKQFTIMHDELSCIRHSHMASEIKPLFNEDGSFNGDNWNSGMDEIRKRLDTIVIAGNDISLSAFRDEDLDNCHEINVFASMKFCSDQWYIIINIVSVDIDVYDSYVITWYKSRGCTEMITKNGRPITIEEYVDMLNLLDELGLFMKTNWRYH